MFGFFKENSAVQKLVSTRYEVVFYAESAYYFQYFRQLFASLQAASRKIAYVTSDKNDPVFELRNAATNVVFSKSTLAFAFSKLQADCVIMTMPDLGNFIFKRSDRVKKYIYVFHALVSTHQQYRAHAFDHYDTIFMAGPHHENEIRESEALYGLPAKNLITYGYPLLDELKAKSDPPAGDQQVLIAPSWYDEGILQTCIGPVVSVFAGTTYNVLIRPHPEFIKRNARAFRQLQELSAKHPNIQLDTEPVLWKSLLSAHYLITDRSGIAFEFALAQQRPVLFIDTPHKRQNSDWHLFKSEAVENSLRSELGISIDPGSPSSILPALEELQKMAPEFRRRLPQLEEKVVYDAGHHSNGVRYILDQLS